MRSLLCKGTDVHQITLSDREQNGCVTDTTHLLDGVLQSGFHCLCEGCSVQGVNVEAPVVGAILIVGVVGLLLFLCLCLSFTTSPFMTAWLYKSPRLVCVPGGPCRLLSMPAVVLVSG